MKEKSMKPKYIILRYLMLFILCAGILWGFMPKIHAEAAGKAVTVKISKVQGNSKERLIVKGLDKKGNVVWKFKTKTYPQMQCDYTFCLTKKNRVYVFESGKVTALKKKNGKKIWTCENITVSGHVAAVDNKNNVYVTGYMDDNVYKINSKGKIVWKTNVAKTGNYWAYKMKCKGGKLTITYEGNESGDEKTHKVILKAGSGKILKYN